MEQLKKISISIILFGLVVLLCSVIKIESDENRPGYQEVQEFGIVTTAEVTRKREGKPLDWDDAVPKYITYEFEAIDPESGDKRKFHKEYGLYPVTYRETQVGDTIEIIYLSNDPGYSWISGREPSIPPSPSAEKEFKARGIFGGLGIILLGIIILFFEYSYILN